METVGIRELKNRLGHYLRLVRRGGTIVVTSRGKAVARLVPVASSAKPGMPPKLEERLWQLAAEGRLSWSGGMPQLPEPAAVNRGPQLLSDLVVENRE